MLVLAVALTVMVTMGVRITSYKLMFEDQVRDTVLEILEERK